MTLVNICGHCRELFTVKRKREANKFCSRDCYYADLTAKGRPEREATGVEFKCAQCGAPFSLKPGHLRSYRKQWGKDPLYCSRACSHVGRTGTETKTCPVCSTQFATAGHSRRRTETCSDPCRRALQKRNLIATNERERPSSERAMTRREFRGYVMLRYPSINGVRGDDIYEHRHVMEQHLGRKLRREETVHHRLKPTTNNDLSNLELFSSRHGPGQRVREQVDWAIKILLDYPDFLDEAGYESLKARAQDGSAVSLNALFDASPPNGHAAAPNVSAT